MITQIFPVDFFVKVRPPNFEEIVSAVSPLELDDSSIQDENWGTNCMVKTIYLNEDVWRSILAPGVKQFCGQMGWKGDFQVLQPWLNFYKRGYFQEPHRHVNCDFAAVVFLNSGENYAQFYFQNRMMGYIPPLIEELASIGDSWYPNVEPGDMLFFPSYLLHGVTPHYSDEVRKTLSFNINFL
jgi:hypothetical protein